ncbi:MAG: hypothetical protein EBT14_04530 [Betaproteobacteria bacterium]|jgi:uncharacterized protein YoxC|nr:hypothetical protein [Betaproteobacteria bacterium]
MEILVLAVAIAMAILALVLYLELKRTQDRMDSVKSELELRVRSTINQAMHDTAEKIPAIEHRVDEMAEKIAHAEAELSEIRSGKAKEAGAQGQQGGPVL